MAQFGSALNAARKDPNGYPSMIGVMGTLGTADTAGTSLTLPIAVDPSTGALFVQDLASSGGTQPVSGTVVNGGGSVALDPKIARNVLTFGTAGTSAVGTLVAAGGVGTAIWLTSFSIDGDSTTLGTAEVILSFGTQVAGTAVLFRATLATLNGAAIMNYGAYPVNGGITNLPLTYLIQTGAGTVAWNVTYFVA